MTGRKTIESTHSPVTDLNVGDGDDGTRTLCSVEANQFSENVLFVFGRNNAPGFFDDTISGLVTKISDGAAGKIRRRTSDRLPLSGPVAMLVHGRSSR